ncbi:MAG: hypothetical protein HN350_06215 [Phycisphaerales bacterium]|jgi:hypothetical protein|nr:hypothetical protein [Phycisphaerales bacterium]
MPLRKDYIRELAANLGLGKSELLARIREMHPEREFKAVFVVADEEGRYVVVATYEIEHIYRGHPPSLAFAVHKKDSTVEEIDHAGYGLGIK